MHSTDLQLKPSSTAVSQGNFTDWTTDWPTPTQAPQNHLRDSRHTNRYSSPACIHHWSCAFKFVSKLI